MSKNSGDVGTTVTVLINTAITKGQYIIQHKCTLKNHEVDNVQINL